MRTNAKSTKLLAACSLMILFSLSEKSYSSTLNPQCTLTGTVGESSLCIECHVSEGVFSMATAAPPESKADECAICHIDPSGYTTDNANLHHSEGARRAELEGTIIDCLECHALSVGQGGNYLVNEPFNCFLNCHTPSFIRDSERFLIPQTGEMYRENGWDISGMAKRKMGEQHHYNFAPADYSSWNCYRCHSFEWDPELNAQVTVHVPGAAGYAQDVNNIRIQVATGLVHDINPGDTLALSAEESEGDIKTVRWSINNQPISYGNDFSHTFKWAAAGDTYVIKLEIWSWDNRYAKQNIVVNVR